MVTLETIRKDMEAQLELDSNIQSVEVNADSLDEALADAAVQLDSRVSHLEYEVIEKGSDGFLGLAKKPWKLRIYQTAEGLAKKKKTMAGVSINDDELDEEIKTVDQDGMFYIRHFGDKICLKVILPIGKGSPVDPKAIINDARRTDTLGLDEDAIRKFAKSGTDGKYEAVGDYKHVKAGDAMLVVDISKDEMLATVTVTPPAMSGAEISAEQIIRNLETQGVVAGVENDKIDEFVDNPVYNVPCEVAAAIKPQDGRDAYIAFNFETDPTKLKIKETKNGQVNFKELNQIQNVVKGQPLATKMPPERGKAGKTLFGRYLEAKNGKDIKIPLGKNVELDKDGVTILASMNGRVMYESEKINVEPVLELDAVNIKTGNIDFLGAVIVKGNVEDGYDVKASGNIEVGGTVGQSHLKSENGDIIVSQGIFGHDVGVIQAGKSLWAKFIQSAKVEVVQFCIVSDSIMNSEVTAMKRIILNGKKAQITGGHLFATEEIAAKNIGSPGGGAETILEVGFDPRLKQRLGEIQDEQNALMKELEDTDNNIVTLENFKKQRRTLAKEKQDQLDALKKRKDEISVKSEEYAKEVEQILQRLHELKVFGTVKAFGTVYSGVKIYIRDVVDEVRTDVKSVTFFFENGFVRRGKYEEPDMNGIKAPDGYSAG
ncbi:MAG: FapA family protein [Treponema sp.]|nr:FapA family protein [Treponema sp.]